MKVVLTGSNGQLGNNIIKYKPEGVNLIPTNKDSLDLSRSEKCLKYILSEKPDWIINCGAYTNVEKADSEKEIAMQVNANAPMIFSEALLETGGKLLQISTDFVFDGQQSFPYSTKEKKSPINVYGKSKAKGEDFIEQILKNKKQAIILRTSWVMGLSGENFLTKIMRLLKEKDLINVVYDQISAPTTAESLAKVCWSIVEKNKFIFDNYHSNLPIIHFSNCGCASWYDVAIEIKKLCKEYNLIEYSSEIKPISYKHFPSKIMRPCYSLLDNENIRDLIEIPYIHWKEALNDVFSKINYEKF